MIYGYVRVSTDMQDNGPQVQRARIDAACRVDEYFEEHVSGKNMKRPELQALLSKISKGDTLVVTKVDRLSRSVLDFAMLMQAADKAGWKINVLELGIDMDSPMGKAMVQMMAVFAELERSLISGRVKDAMAVVKLKGTKSGKPIGRPREVPEPVRDRILQLRAAGRSLRDIGAEVNLAHTTVARIVNSQPVEA